ncbi:MAG: hypothetical protein AB1649_12030 [Chloroflexota bacterium]
METIVFRKFLFVVLILASASLACQGGGFGVSPTATPTNTPEPTFTPTPFPTPTLAAAVVTPPPDGMTLEKQSDGSMLYRDYESGVEMLIPSSWVVMSANAEDFQASLEVLSDENPELASAMQTLSGMDSDVFRIIAFDKENFTESYVTNFTSIQAEDAMAAALPIDMITQLTAESLESQYPNAKMIGSGVRETGNGVEVGYVELEMPLNLQGGTVFQAYQKQYYLTHNDHLIVITFSTPREMGPTTVVFFDEVIDQLKFFEP